MSCTYGKSVLTHFAQVGLNGVDNGSMRFTGVRIPRGNLLDRFCQVDRGGKYSSPFSPSRRFAATLGELTGGRVGLTCASIGILKVNSQVMQENPLKPWQGHFDTAADWQSPSL